MSTFRPGSDMVSRVGRQIEEKLNTKEALEQLLRRRKHIPPSAKPRERKLVPPQHLIAMLDAQEQQEAEAGTAEKSSKDRLEEDFVFRRQSRQEFYRATQPGEVVPPVGYYDPNFKSVEKEGRNTAWEKRTKRGQKACSMDEGAMKLGVERQFPVRATLRFDKQLGRNDSAGRRDSAGRNASPEHFDTYRWSSLTDRVSVPDMSKTLCRPEVFPGTRQGNPDYRPNFTPIWKRLSRNLFFDRIPARKVPRPGSHDLVYENISYRQVEPKVATPSFAPKTARADIDESPLPLFMRNLTSWQSTFSVNEKALQMNGSLQTPRRSLPRSAVHTAASSPFKRNEQIKLAHVRSSSHTGFPNRPET